MSPPADPPADPAWSMTMHDLGNPRLVANPIDRYPIGRSHPIPAECCIVADTGLIASLPISLSARPKRKPWLSQ